MNDPLQDCEWSLDFSQPSGQIRQWNRNMNGPPTLNIPGPTEKFCVFYRTADGLSDYYFSFERQQDGSWLPFILSQPSYQGRPTGLHDTHRLKQGDRYYVCWDSPLMSLEDAKSVAALWADKTQEYIATGRTFG